MATILNLFSHDPRNGAKQIYLFRFNNPYSILPVTTYLSLFTEKAYEIGILKSPSTYLIIGERSSKV